LNLSAQRQADGTNIVLGSLVTEYHFRLNDRIADSTSLETCQRSVAEALGSFYAHQSDCVKS
jgi:hypothetical protein